MTRSAANTFFVALCGVAATGCGSGGGGGGGLAASTASTSAGATPSPTTSSTSSSATSAATTGSVPVGGATTATRPPIDHVFIIVKENHTFDNYFGTFPGAD